MTEKVIEVFGPDDLTAIVAFFQSDTGSKLLAKAQNHMVFRALGHRQPGKTDPTALWPQHLSLQERNSLNAFLSSDAGQTFVRDIPKLQGYLYGFFQNRNRWPAPALNRDFVIKAIKTPGVFTFANRTQRQAILRDLRTQMP